MWCDRRTALSWTLVAVVAVGWLSILLSTPYYHDDVWYLYQIRHWWTAGGQGPFPWDGLWRDAVNRWWYDSPRLGNLLAPLLMAALPKWVLDTVSALCIGALVPLTARTAGITMRQPLPVALTAVALTMLLPWHHGMLCVIFLMNYVWASVLLLWALGVWQGWYRASPLGAWVLGAATSWMFEGAGVALLCAIAAMTLLTRRWRTTRVQMWLLVGLVVGLWHLLAPGFVDYRLMKADYWTSTTEYGLILGRGLAPVIAVAAFIGILSFCPKGRRWLGRTDRSTLLMLLVMAVVLSYIAVNALVYIPRYMFMPRLLAVAAGMTLLKAWAAGWCRKPSRPWRLGAAALVAVLLAVHFAGAAYYNRLIRGQNDAVLAYHLGRDTSWVPLHVTSLYDTPWWVLHHAGDFAVNSPVDPMLRPQHLYGPMPPILLVEDHPNDPERPVK